MYNSHIHFSLTASLSPQPHPPLPKPQHTPPPDTTMCHYTFKFYECSHKLDDNVRGCDRWQSTGTHCDIDKRAVRLRDGCSIRTDSVTGLCPGCHTKAKALEERRKEEEAIKRDLEKAKKFNEEEQKRAREAHEAHLRRVEQESLDEFEARFQSEVSLAMSESAAIAESAAMAESAAQAQREQAERDQAKKEEELLMAALESSMKEYVDNMEDRYGDSVEDGSTRLEAIKRTSTMDWHHKKWGTGAKQLNGEVDELGNKLSSRLQIEDGRPHSKEVHGQQNDSSNRRDSLMQQGKLAQSSMDSTPTVPLYFNRAVKTTTVRTPFHCVYFESKHHTDFSLQRPSSSGSSNTEDSISSSRPSSPPASSTPAGVTTAASPPPPPPLPPQRGQHVKVAPPKPSFPPTDYSQAPKDQKYGHMYVGTRRQPIHPSQGKPDEDNIPTSPPLPSTPHKSIPAARLASGVTPMARSPPTSPPMGGFAGIPAGDQRNRLRPTARAPPKEQGPSELEAMWSRRGIQKEDDEEDGIPTKEILPNESASQMA